jgi:hypothetical protein
MIFSNYFIGFIEDNVWAFTMTKLIKGLVGCTPYLGYPTGNCINAFSSSEPLSLIPDFLLAKFFNPVFGYNLVIFVAFSLNLFFSFRFFKKLFGTFISCLLSVAFLASPFFYYHGRSHIDLIQFWPVIWFLDTLLFSKAQHKNIYLGLLLVLITGVSNYLGYFTLVFAFIYLIFSFLLSKSKILVVKKHYSGVFVTVVVFILFSSIFLAPYIRANYLLSEDSVGSETGVQVLKRPFEDFITFSTRPWYYLMPSVDNPFFGKFSQDFLTKISSGGNYLTTNYFKSEHSNSFLGWANLVLGIIGCIYLSLTLKNRRDSIHDYSINFLAIFFSVVGLIILSIPPHVSVSGVSFYMPSLLLFKVFPMFRVLARMGILILFLTLIFTGYGYEAILRSFSSSRVRRLASYFIIMFLSVFTLVEFFIPIKVTDVSIPPKIYTYLAKKSTYKFPIVVYPYSKTSDAAFWIGVYKEPLINPRFYENYQTGFVSEEFTKNLVTADGIDKAREMGAAYLIYFYETDKNVNSEVFNNFPSLSKVEQFVENSPDEWQIQLPFFNKYVIAKIINAGNGKSNSAILYSFK